MRVVELKEGVFACMMSNETANAGFVITDRGFVVIDSLNTPARGRQLAAEIKRTTTQACLFVINTHHHYDHVFGNQAFEAPVIGHHTLAEQLAKAASRDLMPVSIAAWVSEHPEDRWLAEELTVIYPSVAFEQRLLLDLRPARMVVQHVGGHTPDSSVVHLPEHGVLFAGDLVFEGRVPYLRDAHIGDTIQALGQLAALEADIIVPGHGALCDSDYVLRCRGFLQALRQSISEMLRRGWQKAEILDSGRLPKWWTEDRPNLMRANVERIYEELTGPAVVPG